MKCEVKLNHRKFEQKVNCGGRLQVQEVEVAML